MFILWVILLILPRYSTFRSAHPLRFELEIFQKKASSETNKQHFSIFDVLESCGLWKALIDASVKKNHYLKHCKNPIFRFSLRSLHHLGAAILNTCLIGLNLRIFQPKMDQMT